MSFYTDIKTFISIRDRYSIKGYEKIVTKLDILLKEANEYFEEIIVNKISTNPLRYGFSFMLDEIKIYAEADYEEAISCGFKREWLEEGIISCTERL